MRPLYFILLLAALALAGLVWSQHRGEPQFVSGFVESHQVRVGSRVGGRVTEVHVREGQAVRRGDPLLALEPFDLHERRAEARAELAAREAHLLRLQAGARPEEIGAARAALDRARAVLDKAVAGPRPLELRIQEDRLALARAEFVKVEKDFDRVRRLVEHGQASADELDEVTRAFSAAEANLSRAGHELELLREGTRDEEIAEARALHAEASKALALLEAGSRSEDIAEAEAMVAVARAAVAAVERQIEELVVAAPVDSVVEAINLRPGDLIAPNAPVVALNDPAELWVRAYVPENRLDLQLGQRVEVRVDSFPGRTFAGHITFIAREGEFTPANIQTPEERIKQVFRIKVHLDEGLDVLRPGMAADVHLGPRP